MNCNKIKTLRIRPEYQENARPLQYTAIQDFIPITNIEIVPQAISKEKYSLNNKLEKGERRWFLFSKILKNKARDRKRK